VVGPGRDLAGGQASLYWSPDLTFRFTLVHPRRVHSKYTQGTLVGAAPCVVFVASPGVGLRSSQAQGTEGDLNAHSTETILGQASTQAHTGTNVTFPLKQGPLVRCAPYLLVVTPPVGVLRSNQAPGTHANLNTEQWEYFSLQFATIRRPSTVTFGYPHGSSLQAPRLGSSKPSFYIL
jgi:hypothetical protein